MSLHFIDKTNTTFETIHAESKGKITLAINLGGDNYKQLCYGSYNELQMSDFNSYFSINTFKGWRNIDNLYELKANYLEFDFDSDFETKKLELLSRLLWDYFLKKVVPFPTLIVDSGHGIWLIWLYHDIAICQKNNALNIQMLNKWNLVQEKLYDALKSLKPDPASMDACRVMRSTGTINYKSDKGQAPVKLVDIHPYCYTMDKLLTHLTGKSCDSYITEKTSKKAAKKAQKPAEKPAKKHSNYNVGKTNRNRVKDLETLAALRGYNIEPGMRELYLFIYAYHLQIITDDKCCTLERTLALNRKFVHPLSEAEVRRECYRRIDRAVEKRFSIGVNGYRRGGYNYKSETIINMFNITKTEMEHLQTICLGDVKIERHNAQKRQDRRNSNGLTDREQEKINKIYQCHIYFEKGYSVSEIANFVGINKSNVSRYLKLNKPENRLVKVLEAKSISNVS